MQKSAWCDAASVTILCSYFESVVNTSAQWTQQMQISKLTDITHPTDETSVYMHMLRHRPLHVLSSTGKNKTLPVSWFKGISHSSLIHTGIQSY